MIPTIFRIKISSEILFFSPESTNTTTSAPTADCTKSVVRSHNLPKFNNSASMVLTEGTEVNEQNLTNYWLSPWNATGSKAQLVIDLGCNKMVNGFYIRNINHGQNGNQGTGNFTLYMCETADGPWTNILTENLGLFRSIGAEMTFFYPLTTNI